MEHQDDRYALWHNDIPFPSRDEMSFLDGARDTMVHRAGSDGYDFLHDAAIVAHDGALHAAWYNCPQGEIVGEALIRGRTSRDNGQTWSDVEVIAADRDKSGTFYVPVQLLSYQGRLYAFVANMVGHDLVTRCEVFVRDDLDGEATWESCGPIADAFLPNCAPVHMDDGSFIMAGRVATTPGTKPLIPAVAISSGSDVTGAWEIVRLLPRGMLPDGAQMPYPETTVIVEHNKVSAVVRNDLGNALIFFSDDYGRTWSPPSEQSFPIGAAKICAGKLSTSQRYLISNTRTDEYRDLLTIAVTRPGDLAFSMIWKIRDGYADGLCAGPEWSYPCAVEHDGTLHIVYTSEKHHCALTAIPVESLLTVG
jgi:hypothetical protein